MMTRSELTALIRRKKSFLCVGLDPDMERIPECIRKNSNDPLFDFNRRIIDATIGKAVAFKPNIAFYEMHGSKGWESLEKTMAYIAGHRAGPVFSIADAKRADIGNSSAAYARTFLESMPFDAVTVSPYMGHDSVRPFLSYQGKWAVILALTSNPGAADFQVLSADVDETVQADYPNAETKLYEVVMKKCMDWGSPDNMMFVVGATKAGMLGSVRQLVPDHFFLIPGVGAQGGDLPAIASVAMNNEVGILVNSSRGILYASSGDDFDNKAGEEAARLQEEMEAILGRQFSWAG